MHGRNARKIEVASFTDAWIETSTKKGCGKKDIVASFTDAWIETAMQNPHFARTDVASFTDAWIETTRKPGMSVEGKSHLLQMRGLKHT